MQTAPPSPMLSFALELLAKGYSVIPVSSPGDGGTGKQPLVPWQQFQNRKPTEQEIREWFTRWPDANIGVVTGSISGLVVIDVDGPEGERSAGELDLPVTLTSRTGKGRHLLFKHPGIPISNSVRLRPGLDVRADGGFIVAPPSTHASGTVYQWLDQHVPVAELPAQTLALLTSRTSTKSVEVEWGGPILDGSRNDTLYRLGRSLNSKGFDPITVETTLDVVNRKRCIPPLDPAELAQINKQVTTQPHRPEFEGPTPEPPRDPLEPIRALPFRPDLGHVAGALTTAFRSISLHIPDPVRREVAQRDIVRLLETDKLVDGAFRLVQLAASTMKHQEAQARKEATAETGGGTVFTITDPEVWPEPVDGGAWLQGVTALLREYLLLPEHAAEAIALWILFTYALEASDIAPLLAILSPEKRSGKSRLLTLLHYLVRRPIPASNVTGPTVFRVIEKWAPTLLIDEADSFINGDDALRGIINSGHTRSLAMVIRTVGDDHEPRMFSTWGCKALAKIGKLDGPWETVADRAIVVNMRRRAPHETVNPSFPKKTEHIIKLQQQAMRWAIDHVPDLLSFSLPDHEKLDDRAADNWRPLFAIAQVVGKGWPERAEAAALALSGSEERETKSPGVLLLEDVRAFFLQHTQIDRVASAVLITWLVSPDLEERPWSTWRRGQPLTLRGLSRLLDAYRIKPERWTAGVKLRGYRKAAFEDAWARYLAPPAPDDMGPDSLEAERTTSVLHALPSSPPETPAMWSRAKTRNRQ